MTDEESIEMTSDGPCGEPRASARVAVFWDKSYLWGLIAYRTFRCLGVDFRLLSAQEIKDGALSGFDIIFVPGGWASDKIAALGDEGARQIQSFVSEGGSYLGFCGGAGLALKHDSGLCLAPFGRLPARDRLPSFSGRIVLKHVAPAHPIWRDVSDEAAFHAWWPGQFALDGNSDVKVLARYGDPQAGSFVTDLPVTARHDWDRWEKAYGLNLNPQRIIGEPAVIESPYGKGRVILSYLHFETPWDQQGNLVLLNLIDFLSGGKPPVAPCPQPVPETHTPPEKRHLSELGPAAAAARAMERQAADFIHFGKENFLWYWRSSWLLQWRRGVKGIEYSSLYGMLAELERLAEKYDPEGSKGDAGAAAAATPAGQELDRAEVDVLAEMITEFLADARQLVMRERFALSQGPVSPLNSDDDEINTLRERMFSLSKRCGGLYEEILEKADGLLLPLLRRESLEDAAR